MPEVRASSKEKNPNYHASLSDGSYKLGIKFLNQAGEPDRLAYRAEPYPRQALKTSTGEGKYSDLEPPYFVIAQDDLTGGRGNEDYELDTSRYFDGSGIDASKDTGIILGPKPHYATGDYRDQINQFLGDWDDSNGLLWWPLYGNTNLKNSRYTSKSFSSGGGFNSYQCEIYLRRVGDPGNISVGLWSNSGGDPSSELAVKSFSAANVTTDVLTVIFPFVWTGSTTLAPSTVYHVVVYGAATDDANNHWEVGCMPDWSGKRSSDGISWSGGSYGPLYKITDSPSTLNALFFEYKSALYMVTRPDSGNSFLYINGDRGAADSNSGNLGQLTDGTKSWSSNEYLGGIVLITKGPGSEESQPWREITGNTNNDILVSPDWNITHTTSTEYVILGSDDWIQLADLGMLVTDVAVAGENIYFARGESANGSTQQILRYRFYNNSGAWSSQNTTENVEASRLIAIRHPGEGDTLYGAQNDHPEHGVCIWRGLVPKYWGNLYYKYGDMVQTDEPWDSLDITNVTQTKTTGRTRINIDSGFTTGLAAVKNLAEPLDITNVDEIGLKIRSSVACSTGNEIELAWDDIQDLGQNFLPSKIWRQSSLIQRKPDKAWFINSQYFVQPIIVYHLDEEGLNPTYTDLSNTYDCNGSNREALTIETDDSILIGAELPFTKIFIDLVTVNDVTGSDVTVEYGNGSGLPDAVLLDDETRPSTIPMAQDGYIYWEMPGDWVPTIQNGVEAYWVRLTWDVTISNGGGDISISRILILMDDYTTTPLYRDLTNLYDGLADNILTNEAISWTSDDCIAIGSGVKFNKLYVILDSSHTNNNSATTSAEFYNGAYYQSLTVSDSDTEAVAGQPFGQTGYLTFEAPYNWEASTINGVEAYWILLYVSADLDDIEIKDIICQSDDFQRLPGEYEDLPLAYNGDDGTQEQFQLASIDYIYIGASQKFNQINVVLDDDVNNNTSTLTAKYSGSTGYTSVTITDNTSSGGATMAVDGSITFDIPEDWELATVNGVEAYWLQLSVNANLDDVDYASFSLTRSNYLGNTNNDIGTLSADEWAWKTIEFQPKSYPIPDESYIQSVGLRVATDQGSQVVDIAEVALISENVSSLLDLSCWKLPGTKRINAMQSYAGNVDEPIENPWIFTEDKVFELQSHNNDRIVPIPLEEIGALASSDNGIGHCTNNTYIYFNMGEKIERYFNRSMDDVGPDRDSGLPADRRGKPLSLASYPGRVYAGIDGGTDNYSSVMMLKNQSWHEVYRAPQTGLQIKSIFIQAIPGLNTDKLWLSQYSDLVSLIISLNPESEPIYRYSHINEGYLETAWIYANMYDINKTWKSLKLFSENASSTNKIVVDYQVDDETTWKEIGTFDESPVADNDIDAFLPNSRRIRFRLRMYNLYDEYTPSVKAIVTDGVAFVPVKYRIGFTMSLEEGDFAFDILGGEGPELSVEQQHKIILNWANSGAPLHFETNSVIWDDRTMFNDPPRSQASSIVYDSGMEKHILQMTLTDV